MFRHSKSVDERIYIGRGLPLSELIRRGPEDVDSPRLGFNGAEQVEVERPMDRNIGDARKEWSYCAGS